MIVKRALEEPIRQIVENAGLEGSVVVEKVKAEKVVTRGFDAESLEFVDMIQAGGRRWLRTGVGAADSLHRQDASCAICACEDGRHGLLPGSPARIPSRDDPHCLYDRAQDFQPPLPCLQASPGDLPRRRAPVAVAPGERRHHRG
jgi:hypothetical protein